MEADVKGHLVVTGLVQGVGYRYFAHEAATRFRLRGYVRNLWNGDVEVVAEGPRPVIDRLIERLRRGPPMSEVDEIRVTWAPATGDFSDFTIRH